jgi:multiple sugar transport system substrate-binding protein
MQRRNRCAVALGVAALAAGAVAGPAIAAGASSVRAASSGVTLTGKTSGVTLTLMFGSSGPAETAAVDQAAKAWAKASHNKVTVINASNMNQQLDQAFAGGTPPDVFYLGSQQLETFAKQGELLPYAKMVAPAKDFYASLVKAYTWNNTWYCVPKDFSNLALEINTTMWKAAGLTNADIPTNWNMLESDAKKLTGNGVVGLDIGNTLDRLGAFFAENGGSYMNKSGTRFTFNSPQNLQALQFVQSMAKAGTLAFPPQQDSGWAGQAFGEGKAAMATEGNWIIGAMKSSYPNISWEAVPMPAGPNGKQGTLTFTNCWGIPAASKNSAAAVNFVKYLTSTSQQLRFANAFGVLPSRVAAAQTYAKQNPSVAAFVAGTPYAMAPVGAIGFSTVQSQFDSQVAGLATGSSDPATMLSQLQTNANALLRP